MLDGLRQLGPQPLELCERRLEVLPLRRQLLEARLLGVVLLLRERVHPTERLAAPFEPLHPRPQLLRIVALGGLAPGSSDSPPPLIGFGAEARELDVECVRRLRLHRLL